MTTTEAIFTNSISHLGNKSIEIFSGFWTVQDVKKNRNKLFVFGDNNIKRGRGGQAIIRDEENALGIPTKKLPNNHKSSFYTDAEFHENKTHIDSAIDHLLNEFMKDQYEILVFPEDGFGTGLARLPEKAPETFKYLETKVNELKELFS